MNKLIKIKYERKLLEEMLLDRKLNVNTMELYNQLTPYFTEIDNMKSYYPIGRIRLVRLFLESDLSNYNKIFSCYGRFANLVEGVEV